MSQPQIILGTAQYGIYEGSVFNNSETVRAAIDLAKSYGITRIDTARAYPRENVGSSETVIGQAHATDITIDTKVRSSPGQHAPDKLQESIDGSLAALGLDQVNILYLHMPDDASDLADVCKKMNDIYKQGKFRHFGIINYTVPQVREILEICKKNGYISPSVYQGHYNPIVRAAERELLPLLREHGIAFYAYAPAAGGAFSKTSSRMKDPGIVGHFWNAQFGAAQESIARVGETAEAAGMTGHAVALNWVLHHSALKAEHGDAMIIAASRLDQLESTLKALQDGLLSSDLVQLLDNAWEENKATAPSFTPYGSQILAEYLKSRERGNATGEQTK